MIFIKPITKNKTFTANFYISNSPNYSWWDFATSFTTRGSHAGFRFYFSIAFICFEIEFTDNRHWDFKNNCFEEWVND